MIRIANLNEMIEKASEGRKTRGLSLVKDTKLLSLNDGVIRFQVNNHTVTLKYSQKGDISIDEAHCDCEDFKFRKTICKHIIASLKKLEDDPEIQSELSVPELVRKARELGYFPRKIGGDTYDILVFSQLLESGYPILLIGPRGSGKDKLVEIYGRITNQPVEIIPLRGEIDETTLYGRYEMVGKRLIFRYGILPRSLFQGKIVVLDEINACPPDKLFSLNYLLSRFAEGEKEFLLPDFDKVVKVHPSTRIVATMNEGYTGTSELNQALADRFLKLFIDYDKSIDEFILRKNGIDSQLQMEILGFIDRVRDLKKRGEILTDFGHRTTERLAILLKSDFSNEVILNMISLDFYPEERELIMNALRPILSRRAE